METANELSIETANSSESPPGYSERNDTSNSSAESASPFYNHETKTSSGETEKPIEAQADTNTPQISPIPEPYNEDVDLERQQIQESDTELETWYDLHFAKGHRVVFAITRVIAIASLPIMEVMFDSPICNDSSAVFSFVCWVAWSLYTISTYQQYIGIDNQNTQLAGLLMFMFLMHAMVRIFKDDRPSTCGV